jgi:hypothetical protein
VAGENLTIINPVGQGIPLSVAAKELAPVLAYADVGRFAGRRWLAELVDSFVTQNACGYVFVEAEAGMGKTAFAAWLASEREYVSHFSRHAEGRTVSAALGNLSAQLITRFGLSEGAPGGILAGWAQSPSGFDSILGKAAQRARDEGRCPLVLVVDGLDEAEAGEGSLPWGLPPLLPVGVYVIGTHQPGHPPQHPDSPHVTLRIDKDHPRNREDITDYLSTEAAKGDLAVRLAAAGMRPDEFTGLLAQRCDGVWIWLSYVLSEVRLQMRQPGQVSALPSKLRDYYDDKIAVWKADPAWNAGLLRLVATLGVAGEPLPVSTLARLAGAAPESVRRWCDWTLRPLLETRWAPDSTGLRYGIYHSSFREFLTAGPGHSGPTNGSAAVLSELSEAAAAAHERVCDAYLTAFGGLTAGLPTLAADPEAAGMDGGYPLRHLAQHLVQAGRAADLHALLAADDAADPDQAAGPGAGGRAAGRNLWFTAHDVAGDVRGYLQAIGTARAAAKSLGLQLRYALVQASVTSWSAALPPVLLGELVSRSRWSALQALSYVERITDEQRQAGALSAIAARLPAELFSHALSMASAFGNPENSAAALKALAPHVPDGLLDGALDAVLAVLDRCYAGLLVEPLAALSARLPPERIARLVQHDKAGSREWLRAVHAFFSADTRVEGFRHALAEVREGKDYRSLIVAALAPYLPVAAFGQVVAALDTVQWPEEALEALAEHIPAQALGLLLDYAAKRRPSVKFIRIIAPRLLEEQVPAALELCQRVHHQEYSAEAFAALAPRLAEDTARRLLAPDPGWPRSDERRQSLPRQGPKLEFRSGPPQDVGYQYGFAVSYYLGHAYYPDRKYEFLMVGALLDRLPEDEARVFATEVVLPLIHQNARERNLRPSDPTNLFSIAENYAAIARYIPPDLRRQTLTAICTVMGWAMRDAKERSTFLKRFAPLSDAEIDLAFAALENSTPVSWWPGSGLFAADVLAPHLSSRQLDKVLRLAQRLPAEENCFAALTEIGLLQPHEARHETAARALGTVAGMTHQRSQARAVVRLAPILGQGLAGDAVTLLRSLDSTIQGIPALDEIADAVPAAQLIEVFGVLVSTGLFIFDFVPGIPKTLTRLSREGHADLIYALLQVPPFEGNSQLAARLAPLLPPGRIRDFWRPNVSAEALSELARFLPRVERAGAVDEVLDALDVQVPRPWSDLQAPVLGRLGRTAPTKRLTEAIREYMMSPAVTLETMAELAPALPESLLEDAYRFAVSKNYGSFDALVQLAPRLHGALLEQAISYVREHQQTPNQATVLTALACRLPAGHAQWEEILAAAVDAAITSPGNAGLLGELIPRLPEHLRPNAVQAAISEACSRWPRSDPVDELVKALRAPELSELYARLAGLRDPQLRAKARAAVLREYGHRYPAQPFASDRALHEDWAGELGRGALTDLIGASAWWIVRNGSEEDLQSTAQAILDVTTWWP